MIVKERQFKKGLSLAPSELDNERCWLPLEEDSPYSFIRGIDSPMRDTHATDSHEMRAPIANRHVEGSIHIS